MCCLEQHLSLASLEGPVEEAGRVGRGRDREGAGTNPNAQTLTSQSLKPGPEVCLVRLGFQSKQANKTSHQ